MKDHVERGGTAGGAGGRDKGGDGRSGFGGGSGGKVLNEYGGGRNVPTSTQTRKLI